MRGKLIIGTGVTIGENIMPHLLSSFKKSYPEVELSLRILDTNEIKKQVLSYELEMGIVGAQINHKDLFTDLPGGRGIGGSPWHPWAYPSP
ncbi:MAG: LysR substrate-binding domain-containing protein [bacterium]